MIGAGKGNRETASKEEEHESKDEQDKAREMGMDRVA